MKLWLDDVREMPAGFDVHCVDAHHAIRLLKEGKVQFISLDHDLGSEEAGTGYDVARAIESMAYFGQIPRLGWAIHSANPVGRKNMERALTKADEYWSQR